MNKLLTLSQFISYLGELQISSQLRVKFKSRYAYYGIKDITLIPVSADFHIIWKILLEYQAFLENVVTFNMFYDETILFTGLIKSEDITHSVSVYSVGNKFLFTNSDKGIQSLEVKMKDFAELSPSLIKPLYSETGEMIDLTPYTN